MSLLRHCPLPHIPGYCPLSPEYLQEAGKDPFQITKYNVTHHSSDVKELYNDKLRVCFDTCHVNDAGYDLVNDLSGVFEKFDKVIGTDQIGVFHINDSKNVLGAGKDRHENIGFGNIGYDTLRQIIYMEQFEKFLPISLPFPAIVSRAIHALLSLVSTLLMPFTI